MDGRWPRGRDPPDYALFKASSGIQLDWSTGKQEISGSSQIAWRTGFARCASRCDFSRLRSNGWASIPCIRALRSGAGRSSYTVSKLLRLAIDTILAHSQMPLKILAAFGIVISFITFAIAIVFFTRALFFESEVVVG